MSLIRIKSMTNQVSHQSIHQLKQLNRRVVYWAFRSSVRSFAPTAHSGAHGKVVFVYELNTSISYSLTPLRSLYLSGMDLEWGHRRSRRNSVRCTSCHQIPRTEQSRDSYMDTNSEKQELKSPMHTAQCLISRGCFII